MAGFRYIGNLFGGAPVSPPKDNYPFTMTAAQAALDGSFATLATNTELLSVCVNDKLPSVLVEEAAAAATPGAEVRAMWVLPGMLFEGPVTAKNGSSTYTAHANFKIGFPGVQINDLGTGVDAVTAPANGKLVLLRYDATNKRCVVAVSCSLLSNYIANA